MISKNVKVEVALREEDRPIAFLVQMASQFESKILFETGNKQYTYLCFHICRNSSVGRALHS